MPATRRPPRDPDHEAVMSFGDHLDELRKRLILALAAPVPIAILVFFFAGELRQILEAPLRQALLDNGQPDTLQALGVAELMMVDIKLSIVSALVVSGPWILWQAWKFIEPGLYEHERRFARFLAPGSLVLVAAGVAMLYWILLPLMLEMLVLYGVENRGGPPPAVVATLPEGAVGVPVLTAAPSEVAAGQMWVKMPENRLCIAVPGAEGIDVLSMPLSKDSAYAQQPRESEYIDFVLLLLAGIAIVFQMPLAILLLGWAGILRVETLRQNRKIALFGLVIVAAIITPTSDVFSLLLMLVPLYLLYELGILLLVAAPPSAIAEGSIVGGFFRRLRTVRSARRPSGKGSAQATQPESPERPVPRDQPTRPAEGVSRPEQNASDDDEATGGGGG